jgi:KaiB-like protein
VAPASHASEEARRTLERIVQDLDPGLVVLEVCDVASDPATAGTFGIVWTPTLIVERRSRPRVTMVGSLGNHRMTLFRLNRAGVPLLRGVSHVLPGSAPGPAAGSVR